MDLTDPTRHSPTTENPTPEPIAMTTEQPSDEPTQS